MSNGLIAIVSYRAVDVADPVPNEILGRAHLEIREFQISNVGRGSLRRLRRFPQQKRRSQRSSNHYEHGDPDNQTAGVAFLSDRTWLSQAAHEGIVGRCFLIVDCSQRDAGSRT